MADQLENIRKVWDIIKRIPNFSDLSNSLGKAVNPMIAFINRAIYLQKKLNSSLEAEFIRKDSFRENLLKNA